MIKDIQKCEDQSRYVHVLKEQLGQTGGQGAVFRTDSPDIAVKLILDKAKKENLLSSDPEGKTYLQRLEAIRLLPVPRDIPIAFPVELLLDRVGYVMRLLNGMSGIETLLPQKFREILREQIPDWLHAQWNVNPHVAEELLYYRDTGGLRRRLALLGKTASILARLHGSGIVYGDVSPNNIFVSEDVNFAQVWFIDADNLMFEKSWKGKKEKTIFFTPDYGAPELMLGHDGIGFRADVYAFAVLAFRVLSMLHPYFGERVLNPPDDEDQSDAEIQALYGCFPWIFDQDDTSNHFHGPMQFRHYASENLQRLFRQTFEQGRIHFWKRPTIFPWPRALAETMDRTIRCPNCTMTWCFHEEEKHCPYCSKPRPPIVHFQAFSRGEDGRFNRFRWEYVREIEADESAVAVPMRLLRPFCLEQLEKIALRFVVTSQKITVRKRAKLKLSLAIAEEQNGKFVDFSYQRERPRNAWSNGFFLFFDESREQRLIKGTIVE